MGMIYLRGKTYWVKYYRNGGVGGDALEMLKSYLLCATTAHAEKEPHRCGGRRSSCYRQGN